jgi:DNA-binding PadR family transcriptional regulator
MERRGWLESEWGRSDNNRRAKFYDLTARGGEQLRRQTTEVRRYVSALTVILDARGAGLGAGGVGTGS